MIMDNEFFVILLIIAFLWGMAAGVLFLDALVRNNISDGAFDFEGERFVRVDAEPVEEWCEVPVCDEWVESYEWVPCGFQECFQRVRECISPYFIRRRC